MSWSCCTHDGHCQQGQGCPAGSACHGQRAAQKRVDLSKVMLSAAPYKPTRTRHFLALAKWLLISLSLCLLALVWLAATDESHEHQRTSWMEEA